MDILYWQMSAGNNPTYTRSGNFYLDSGESGFSGDRLLMQMENILKDDGRWEYYNPNRCKKL